MSGMDRRMAWGMDRHTELRMVLSKESGMGNHMVSGMDTRTGWRMA